MSTLIKQDILVELSANAGTGFEQVREAGKTAFQAQGFPTNKSEEYKFTAITKKIEQNIQNLAPAGAFDVTAEQVKANVFEGYAGDVLVFANGHFLPSLSSTIEGVEVAALSDKADTALGSIAKPEKDPFCALNQSSFEGGIFISVPKKAQVQKPILLLNFFKADTGQVIQPRVWIEAGDFAEVTFINHSVNLSDASYFVNKVVEVKGGVNTQIRYYKLQNDGKNAIEVSNLETDILKDGRFSSVTISLSGEMVRNNLSLNILGSNSEGNMYGLYLLNGKTHVDNHTNVDHTVAHAESNELYKGILADSSRGVFNGKIFVRQDAQKTNAFQQNNNILLSEDAVVNTKPQLEIWADDVKCSHGCTTGQLDEEALFYLQARGIAKDQAKGLLLYAFAGEVLDHITDESFREYCTELVQTRLGSKF
ncbi:Iron-regulated ABC transporter permease protein SufD [Algoriphagus locisalis]|uniref:Iron-regulated ABC transporter permease protein SufD n=1 Tax=Algoriphagus locisalis TaxID=305507 RepID=A0A1I6XLZ5_9BACT|nr:Fe-S cluster assembly protein SufD [Algoriphagus locisalis]SFT39375.1 Iron-regulated ABC transporter permease protein SufD [Algoriphagus locisalis]